MERGERGRGGRGREREGEGEGGTEEGRKRETRVLVTSSIDMCIHLSCRSTIAYDARYTIQQNGNT